MQRQSNVGKICKVDMIRLDESVIGADSFRVVEVVINEDRVGADVERMNVICIGHDVTGNASRSSQRSTCNCRSALEPLR